MLTAPLHIGHVTLRMISREGYTFYIGSGAIKQPRPQSGLLQDVGCDPAASFF